MQNKEESKFIGNPAEWAQFKASYIGQELGENMYLQGYSTLDKVPANLRLEIKSKAMSTLSDAGLTEKEVELTADVFEKSMIVGFENVDKM